MQDLPVKPTRISREQRRIAKQREKDFKAALKAGSRAAGWRYADGRLFRQQGEWFVSILASLAWQRGAYLDLMIKPMALDRLFWEITDTEDLNSQPLSFRAIGAWVLRPVTSIDPILLDVEEPEALARGVLEWAAEYVPRALQTASIEQMLDDLPDPAAPVGKRDLAICLNILNGDLDRAMQICRMPGDRMGNFISPRPGGGVIGFIEQAQEWIARKQQGLAPGG